MRECEAAVLLLPREIPVAPRAAMALPLAWRQPAVAGAVAQAVAAHAVLCMLRCAVAAVAVAVPKAHPGYIVPEFIDLQKALCRGNCKQVCVCSLPCSLLRRRCAGGGGCGGGEQQLHPGQHAPPFPACSPHAPTLPPLPHLVELLAGHAALALALLQRLLLDLRCSVGRGSGAGERRVQAEAAERSQRAGPHAAGPGAGASPVPLARVLKHSVWQGGACSVASTVAAVSPAS